MKRFLFLLFLLACLTAVSQPLRKGSHVILIRNISTSRFQRITETSNISVLITSGKNISGKIRLIKADTVFFHDTLVRVSDIDKIYYQSKFAFPDQAQYDKRRPAYEAGSHWQIICPPDTVYRNSWTYTVYIHHLSGKVRNELLAPQNPLVYKNFLKWNVAKIFHLEFGLSYERMISKKISWETEVSAILGITSGANFLTKTHSLYNYDGFSVTTYPKFYFTNSRTYLSGVFMYRYLQAIDTHTVWPANDGNGDFQDQYRNDFGLSVRIGFMRRYGRFLVDYYVGGGIKYTMLHQLVYGYDAYYNLIYWRQEDHSADVYNMGLLGPVFNLGIKIGRAFGH